MITFIHETGPSKGAQVISKAKEAQVTHQLHNSFSQVAESTVKRI